MARFRLENSWRLLPVVILDVAVVYAGYGAGLLLRFDGDVPADSWRLLLQVGPLIAAGYVGANLLFGVYRAAWQYGGVRDVLNLALAVAVVTIIAFGVNLSFSRRPIPLSVNLIGGGLIFLAMATTKLWSRLASLNYLPFLGDDGTAQRVLIVGAGDTGQLVAREFLHNRRWGYRPACFVDDDPRKRGMRIHGIPVLGDRYHIPMLVEKQGVDVIALAISRSGGSFRELLTICQGTGVPVRMVPGFGDILRGRAQVGELREVTVDDLLSREPVEIDYAQCSQCVKGKAVLISGAAGSIGSELARQVLSFEPATLNLLDNNETGLQDLYLELLPSSGEGGTFIKAWVGDVADQARVSRVLEAARPQVIFHAAAYKHVPLMEEHPDEAFRVNVLGTLNLCQAATRVGSERFVFISTDKAVRPLSVMGATKRICEEIVQGMGRDSRTVFCAVRFGNVMGSRGSVVPLFWKQIERGGPVFVTHPEASRYFMTVPEAVSLIIQAAAFAQQGQVFMLDMGDEMRIVDLAEKMIRLRGLKPEEIGIVYTGLRPGEKVREDLTAEGERLLKTSHPAVLLVESEGGPARSLPDLIAQVEAISARLDAQPQELAQWIHALAGRGGPEGVPMERRSAWGESGG